MFDQATEAKIAKHAKRYDKAVPQSVKPYIIADDHLDAKIRLRRDYGVKGSV